MTDFETFPADELTLLRNELVCCRLDSFQVAELIAGFLTQRGYGVSTVAARDAASHIEATGCTLPCLQEHLQRLAFVM